MKTWYFRTLCEEILQKQVNVSASPLRSKTSLTMAQTFFPAQYVTFDYNVLVSDEDIN